MSKALIASINQIAADKGLDKELIFKAIEDALVSAYKRNYGFAANVTAEVDRVTGEMRIFSEREVVEEVLHPNTEISLEEARQIKPDAQIGDVIRVETHQPKDFGRIAAQTAKQVILQRIREAERDTVYESFVDKVGEVITAQVRSVDTASGTVTVQIGDKFEQILPREEQIRSENLRRGDYIRLYVVDVQKQSRGPVIRLSRTHKNLLRRLMEQEIPEVRDGTVEIKAIAREPGARSKVAVTATVPGVDPVGSCVGMRGVRIQNIVNELAGEKIDVVEWSPDIRRFIANALSPAQVLHVLLDESGPIRTAIVVVPDRQLSLAIGKEGQNARLAAKLTGWRIDIKSESEAREEGLDVLAMEQARQAALAAQEDLMARAERLLKGELAEEAEVEKRRLAGEEPELPEFEPFPVLPGEEPVWGDPRSLLEQVEAKEEAESKAALDAFERAKEAVSKEMPAFPSFEELAIEEPPTFEPLEPGEREEEAEAEEEAPAAEKPLPEVITADMLRQRMAERKAAFNLDEVEIPEELLAGLDEEEDEDELLAPKKGKKAKAPAKKAKKKKRPKPRRPDDEEDEFDFD